jgi:tetratricopeptide (TPR) repeat protein
MITRLPSRRLGWVQRRVRMLPLLASLVLMAPRIGVADTLERAAFNQPGIESRLLADAEDGRLDDFTLFDAALIASGVTDESRLEAYRTRLVEVSDALTREATAEASLAARGRMVLAGLFRHLLTGQYQAECTEVDRTLDQGHFGCVTTTVLYRCLAERAGLPLTILAEPDHVYCRLDGDSPMEIQTTSPLGFLAADRPGRTGATSLRGGMPAPLDIPPRELSDVQLVAKIYFNRGVALAERRQFSSAVELLQIACRLDPDDAAAGRNWRACWNNWALAEADAGRYQQAASILAHGLRLVPDCGPFQDNEVHVYQRWVSQLCRAGEFDRALELLHAGYQRRPQVPLFLEGRRTVSELKRQD